MYVVFIIQPPCPDDVNVGVAPGKEGKKNRMTGELSRRPGTTHMGGLVCVKARGSRESLPDCATRSYARKVSFALRPF